MKKVITAASRTEAMKRLYQGPLGQSRPDYWLSSHEVFARAYQQYIAVKANQPAGAPPQMVEKGIQWDEDDFAPILAAMDAFLAEKGLLK
jgi:hypothetical protein